MAHKLPGGDTTKGPSFPEVGEELPQGLSSRPRPPYAKSTQISYVISDVALKDGRAHTRKDCTVVQSLIKMEEKNNSQSWVKKKG